MIVLSALGWKGQLVGHGTAEVMKTVRKYSNFMVQPLRVLPFVGGEYPGAWDRLFNDYVDGSCPPGERSGYFNLECGEQWWNLASRRWANRIGHYRGRGADAYAVNDNFSSRNAQRLLNIPAYLSGRWYKWYTSAAKSPGDVMNDLMSWSHSRDLWAAFVAFPNTVSEGFLYVYYDLSGRWIATFLVALGGTIKEVYRASRIRYRRMVRYTPD